MVGMDQHMTLEGIGYVDCIMCLSYELEYIYIYKIYFKEIP